MNTTPTPHQQNGCCDKLSFFTDLLEHSTAKHVVVMLNDQPHTYAIQDFIHQVLPQYSDFMVNIRNNSKVTGWVFTE